MEYGVPADHGRPLFLVLFQHSAAYCGGGVLDFAASCTAKAAGSGKLRQLVDDPVPCLVIDRSFSFMDDPAAVFTAR